MTVYVDPLRPYGLRGEWCHMAADSLDELHAMAEQIGLRREWFQEKARFPHYDLHGFGRQKALELGAMEVTSMQMARMFARQKMQDEEVTNMTSQQMYSDLAPWFHLLTAPEEYAEEAAIYLAALQKFAPEAKSLLELEAAAAIMLLT